MSDNSQNKLSVIMIVKNEAHQIERTLKSVAWADEIVVVDAFSDDNTISICKKYTDKVFQYEWINFSVQRQRSLRHATHSWVLSIDADEVVSEALAQEIQHLLENKPKANGYRVPRKTWYMDRWLEYTWFPDYQLRLFHKDDAFIENKDVHEGFSVKGNVDKLEGILYHYSYQSVENHVEKINQYTTLEVVAKLERLNGRKPKWYHLVFNPLSTFIKLFWFKKGYKDGLPGFILALMSAFYTQLLYAKTIEKSRMKDSV